MTYHHDRCHLPPFGHKNPLAEGGTFCVYFLRNLRSTLILELLGLYGIIATYKMGKIGHPWCGATHLSEKWQIATHPKGLLVKWLKTPEKRPADGISGCCDRKVGATATHLAFSCFPLDPPLWGRGGVKSGANISRPVARVAVLGRGRVLFVSRAKVPTRGDNGLHEGYIFAFGKDVLSWNSSAAYVTGFLAPKQI